MYKDLLIQSGLNANESIIYEYLLNSGESPASDIINNTPLKKGIIYLTLENLKEKALISDKLLAPKNSNIKNKKKITYFSPNHPQKLRKYLENKEKSIHKAKNNLEANFDDLAASFNLSSGKPGIQYFEGIEGMKRIINDSLTAKSTILKYADIKAVVSHINDINLEYVKKRNKLGLKTQVILEDSSFTRNYMEDYYKTTTHTRYIDHKKYPFNSVVQIYDNKISYITLTEKTKIGILIQDPTIYRLNKSIFENVWEHAKNYEDLPSLANSDNSKAK